MLVPPTDRSGVPTGRATWQRLACSRSSEHSTCWRSLRSVGGDAGLSELSQQSGLPLPTIHRLMR
ncbi:helix-turn-helix domain-containing protein, partial [Promicromonospora kroppenstedtii]|uniref:helix-turn-helix domain-containing protein n=1 Tax=Promicromonospora kroppenstedtii TaxID=440482 RepID=UPI003CCBD859